MDDEPAPGNPDLALGREAAQRSRWKDAHAAFSAADAVAPLAAGDLATWSTAAYLVGDIDAAVAARSRAHRMHVEAGEPEAAVRAGFWVAFMLVNSRQAAQAGGWMARCDALLAELSDDAPERGYLLVLESFRQAAIEHAYEEAHRSASRAVEIGREAREEDLVALGLNVGARALIRWGRAAEGLARLDEAMAAVVSGALTPPVAGTVYCSLIEACEEILEIRRAREWTDALNRWCDRQEGMVTFTGQCLTHRAEVLRRRGDLDAAIDAAEEACDRFSGASDEHLAGGALYQLAEVLRIRGETAAADEAYRRSAEWGHDPQPGLALVWLAEGRIDAAESALRRLESEATDPTRRIRMLPAFVEVMLAADDVATAARGADELSELAETFGTEALDGYASHARGAVELARGSVNEALDSLRGAAEVWRSLGMIGEEARARQMIARALREMGDAESASIEEEVARRSLERMGAPIEPFGERDRHGLTTRELEVLRLVATGATNQAIADELYLSVKTVDRHVANILTKLGVSSRTAATAFGYEHRLL